MLCCFLIRRCPVGPTMRLVFLVVDCVEEEVVLRVFSRGASSGSCCTLFAPDERKQLNGMVYAV